MYFTFNQTTGAVAVVYGGLLLFYFGKLKSVWKREVERARFSLVVFIILGFSIVCGFSYLYYLKKLKSALERKAAKIIHRHKNKPLITQRPNPFGRTAKIITALLLTFICLHRIIRKI